MRIVARFVFIALAATASCSITSDATVTGITGTYKLAKVDGSQLPFPLGSSFTVRGQLDLTKGGRFTLTQTDSAASGLSNFSSTGLWTVTDNAIQFINDSGPLQLGIAFGGDSVRTTYRSHENLYTKQ